MSISAQSGESHDHCDHWLLDYAVEQTNHIAHQISAVAIPADRPSCRAPIRPSKPTSTDGAPPYQILGALGMRDLMQSGCAACACVSVMEHSFRQACCQPR